MLVIERHQGESFVLALPNGETVTVMIVAIRHNQKVRVGITAPTAVQIIRPEVASPEQWRKRA